MVFSSCLAQVLSIRLPRDGTHLALELCWRGASQVGRKNTGKHGWLMYHDVSTISFIWSTVYLSLQLDGGYLSVIARFTCLYLNYVYLYLDGGWNLRLDRLEMSHLLANFIVKMNMMISHRMEWRSTFWDNSIWIYIAGLILPHSYNLSCIFQHIIHSLTSVSWLHIPTYNRILLTVQWINLQLILHFSRLGTRKVR